ncbi:MAG TPA: hypothetical protein VLL75_03395 [Vicinamibacteria bacterium]|nr:hypothetical protein [Vicinamibacteria bacterium]
MHWFFYVLLGVGALLAVSRVRAGLRRRQLERCLPVMRGLVAEKRYMEALDLLERTPGLARRYRLPPEQAVAVADLEGEALVGVGRITDAVTQRAAHLSARFVAGQWPAEKLEQWLALYRRAGPIPVEAFFFCEVCGLHPDTEALLRHAIDRGCEPPTGFPGPHDQNVVFLSRPRKFVP